MSDFAGFSIHGVDDEEQEDYGRWLILGPQGSGKSTLASTIATLGKTLYIDLPGEKGIRSFRGAAYSKNIDVIRPESITALEKIFWQLQGEDHPYKAVVIDSLTSVQKMANRFIQGYNETTVREIMQGSKPMQIQQWGQTKEIIEDIAQFWNGLADGTRENPMHVVMITQTKIIDNEFTGNTSRVPEVQSGAQSAVKSNPDYIIYTDLEENIEAAGDDSLPSEIHIVRFGSNQDYSTKARLPVRLRGKIPSILGRDGKQTSLGTLSRILEVGGVPKQTKKTATNKKAETEKGE